MGSRREGIAVVWGMDGGECDCGGPPPAFRLPPPPRPPPLHNIKDCSDIIELETCNAMPVIDAEYHSSPAIPSLAVIVVCSILLLAILLIATALVWKHKKKMQNFLPCKSSPQNHCDVTHGNGVIYEDLTNMRPRTLPQPSMEMLDVKARGVDLPPYHSPVFICPPPSHSRPIGSHQYCSQDLYNPVYEELSNGSGERGDSEGESECGPQGAVSEDEFAEDESSLGGGERGLAHHSGTSSLQGSTGNDLCRDIDSSDPDDRFLGPRNLSLPPGTRVRGGEIGERRPRSLRRLRHKGEFHEGLLLDALLRPPSHRLPYILPVPPPAHYEPVLHYPNRHPEFTTFRPSQDSDSGYSHNTSGGRGSSRGRKDSHRMPQPADLVLS